MSMRRAANPNLEILERAAFLLGPLREEVVFVGGCATGLLLTDSAAPPVRATLDVDVIVELATLGGYYRFADALREQGFAEDSSEGAPLCRWRAEGVVLDVMPTETKVLGFANRWYRPAMAAASWMVLPSGVTIRMVAAPHFIATKLEAFAGRGGADYLLSHDMEDLIAVFDGRAEVVDEIRVADDALQGFLAASFRELLEDRRFVEALPGFLPGDAASQRRLPLLVERLEAIARRA